MFHTFIQLLHIRKGFIGLEVSQKLLGKALHYRDLHRTFQKCDQRELVNVLTRNPTELLVRMSRLVNVCVKKIP